MKLNSASWIALSVVVFATLAEVAQAAPLVNDAGGLDLETNLQSRGLGKKLKGLVLGGKKGKKGEGSTSREEEQHHSSSEDEGGNERQLGVINEGRFNTAAESRAFDAQQIARYRDLYMNPPNRRPPIPTIVGGSPQHSDVASSRRTTPAATPPGSRARTPEVSPAGSRRVTPQASRQVSPASSPDHRHNQGSGSGTTFMGNEFGPPGGYGGGYSGYYS